MISSVRGALVGGAAFPLWLDFTVLLALSIALAGLGVHSFLKTEA